MPGKSEIAIKIVHEDRRVLNGLGILMDGLSILIEL